MMQRYSDLRVRHSGEPNLIIAMRMGDFYEVMFHEAKEAAQIMGVTLTKRNGVPMCGFPFHAAQQYISKLVSGGKRVALVEDNVVSHILSAPIVEAGDSVRVRDNAPAGADGDGEGGGKVEDHPDSGSPGARVGDW